MSVTKEQIGTLPFTDICISSLGDSQARISFTIDNAAYYVALRRYTTAGPYYVLMIHHDLQNNVICPYCKSMPTLGAYNTCISLHLWKQDVVDRLLLSNELRLLVVTGTLQIENQ